MVLWNYLFPQSLFRTNIGNMYPLSRKDSKVAYIAEGGYEFLRTLNFNIFNQLKDLQFYYHQM